MPEFPEVLRVRQSFGGAEVEDVRDTVMHQLAKLELDKRVRPGQSVAITAGSRGIANVGEITCAIVDYVKSIGGQPHIVAAMGSHGGATVDGQQKILASLGITESHCACPVQCGTETAVALNPPDGFPVHVDKRALAADHVILCNRIKPHTSIAGRFESGLMKMMFVGLGNHEGARLVHQALAERAFDDIVERWAPAVIAHCNILGGVAIIENAVGQTARIEAIASNQLLLREPELLDLARDNLARLPFDDIDLLIIDEIGKNISGTGLDTNVVGRKFDDHQARPDERPRIKRIAVRSLTPQSAGNATGLGIAEFCRRQVLEQMDLEITRINCQAAGHPGAAKVPTTLDSDGEMIAAALSSLSVSGDARLVWIHNTLRLTDLMCSTSFRAEIRKSSNLQIVQEARPLPFDSDSNLVPFFD